MILLLRRMAELAIILKIMGQYQLYRQISIEGVEGTVLIRTGTPAIVSFPGEEIFKKFPAPLPVMALSDGVIATEEGNWRVGVGKVAEICIAMDITLTDDSLNKWLEEYGGGVTELGQITTPVPLPEKFLLYSLALVDENGNVSPSPLANSDHNWPERMKVEEFFSAE